MAKFKLSWENSPDTPINSSSLSKFVDHSSNGPILFVDIDAIAKYGTKNDNLLKVRIGTKVGLRIPNTNAYFDFNQSLTSHNSNYTPVTSSNCIFSEFSEVKTGSLFIGDQSVDLLTNAGFESNMTGWEGYINDGMLNHQFPVGLVDYTVGSGAIKVVTSDFYPKDGVNTKSLLLQTGPLGRVQVDQTLNLSTHDAVSFSFYYKSSGGLNVRIDSGSYAWKDGGWLTSSSAYYPLPDTGGEWAHYEIPAIDTTHIVARSAVKFIFYSELPNSSHLIDSTRVDDMSYCAPFGSQITGQFQLNYDASIIDLESGSLSFSVMFKKIQSMDILKVTTANHDAMSLGYDEINDAITFQMFNEATQSFIATSNSLALSNNINKWIKFTLSWDALRGIKMQSSIFNLSQNINTYTPTNSTLLQTLSIAKSAPIAAYLDALSIDFGFRTDLEMSKSVQNFILPKEDTCKMFEFEDSNAVVDISCLDTGASFGALKTYYLWLVDDMNDYASLIASLSSTSPAGVNLRYARKFGGFRTDAAGKITSYGVWDIWSKRSHISNVDRFTVGGSDTESYQFDIRTSPIAETTDVRSTIPVHFSNTVQYRLTGDTMNSGVPYAEFNNTGWFGIDNVKIDANNIATRNYDSISNDLNIYTYGSSTLKLTSNEIKLVSGASDIKLDTLRVNNNVLYSAAATNMIIDATVEDTNNEIVLKSKHFTQSVYGNDAATISGTYTRTINGTTTFDSTGLVTISSSGSYLALEGINISTNNIYNSTGINMYVTGGDIVISSNTAATNFIKLDTFKIKNNLLSVDAGSINIQAPDDIVIGKSTATTTADATNVIINSDNFIVNSQTVSFNNINAADFIRFDSLKIKQNILYTDGTDSMGISSLANINIHASSAVIVDSTTPEMDINTVLKVVGATTITGYTKVVGSFEVTTNALVTGTTQFVGETTLSGIKFSGVEATDWAKIYASKSGVNTSTIIEFGDDVGDNFYIKQVYGGTTDNPLVIDSANMTVNRGLVLNGNLTVNGSTTTVNSTNTNVTDKTFTINVAASVVNQDASYEVARTTTSAKLQWIETSKRWNVDNADGAPKEIVFVGYDSRFNPSNLSLVSIDNTGVKLENNYAVGGMELIAIGGGLINSTTNEAQSFGHGILNVGIHTNDFLPNKMGVSNPIGAWLSIDTRPEVGGNRFRFYHRPGAAASNLVLAEISQNAINLNQKVYFGNAIELLKWDSGNTNDDHFIVRTQPSPTIAGTNELLIFANGKPSASTSTSNNTVRIAGPRVLVQAFDEKVANNSRSDSNFATSGIVTAIDVTNTGVTFGVTISAPTMTITGGADTAECWKKDDGEYEFGQVVVRTETGFKVSTKRAERATLGVISSTYATLYNSTLFNPNDFHGSVGLPIGIIGTVQIKLAGKAKIGDELVSYKKGQAIKANWFEKLFRRERILGVFDGYADTGWAVLRIK
jgi:hypothetical protein